MHHRRSLIIVVLFSAVTVLASSARADSIVWTGEGDGVSWSDINNWEIDNSDPPVNQVPALPDLAFINNEANVTVDSSQNIGSFAIGHNNLGSMTSGVSRLNIGPGVTFTVNNTSRIGRGVPLDALGSARGEVWQTGGTVHFTSGNRRLGLSYDARTDPNERNADSLYVISGGSLMMDGTGSIQVGRATNTFKRAEFRVVGSGASLIHIGTGAGGDLLVEGGLAAAGAPGEAVLRFVLDAGGVTPITVGDELRLNTGSRLEIGVSTSTLPTTDITLITADRLTGNEIFDGLPEGSDISTIFTNRLFEWSVAYQDGLDDGVLDAFVKLTNPRSFRGGDANKDGTVNLADFNVLAGNFGSTMGTWNTADFNGDGLVNLADFNVLAGNFGLSGLSREPTTEDWSTLAAAVPEPATLGIAMLTGLALLTRRRG